MAKRVAATGTTGKRSGTSKLDAVFEGGGVRGSAFVGAIEVTESLGYTYENLAGTSAGAIVAGLLAAGYRAAEIKAVMDSVDYARFKDATTLDEVPLAGPAGNVLLTEGIYKGDYAEQWIRGLLAAKNIRTFADLVMPEYADDPRFRYKLQVVASDITRGKLLVLPGDAVDYGITPDSLDVAKAIRMSMSIPFFFEPVVMNSSDGRAPRGGHQKNYIVDGGILSNYPVWLLDDGTPNPPWPTIGYKLVDPTEGRDHEIDGPIDFLTAMFETMMDAHDARYIEDKDFARSVPIKTLGVQSTDFGITSEQKDMLAASGKKAAQEFFKNWDFEKYKKKYRAKKTLLPRSEKVWGE
jgi:NTE family protein